GPTPSPQVGTSFKDCDDCPVMVEIPAGSFLMGAAQGETGAYTNESPQHIVTFTRPFALEKYEVTTGDYARFVEASGHDAGSSCYVDTPAGYADTAGKNWLDPGFPDYIPSEQD